MTRTLSATLTIVALLAACGGEHREAATRSDSAVSGTASAAPSDTAGQTAAAPTPAAPAESAASAPSAAAKTDTGANRPTASKADGKKLAASEAVNAHKATKAPAGQAKRDTARVRQEEQDTTKTAAAGQDTTKAAAAQDTSKAAPQAAGSTSTASAEQDQPLRDAYHQAPKDTVDQATYDGWKQFNLNCARCHGEDVLGTTIAPHLIVSLKPDGPINTTELFIQTVCAGRPAKGMPSWCALGLDMNKINDIYLYVKGRSDAKLSPGRPAVKGGEG
jgi:FtsZ-interacting cell division protein ZipA